MYKYFSKLLFILPANNVQLLFVACIFILTSCIEALGIGIIGPFIALASDFSIIENNSWLASVYKLLSIEQENQFVAIIGLFAVSIYLLKSIAAWATQVFITRFCNRQQRLLITRMASGYIKAPYVYHITKNSSSIIDRLIEVANTFSNTVFIPLLTTLANIFLFLTLFILLCFTSLPVMLGLLVILLPVLFLFNSFAPKLRQWGKQMRDSKSEIIQTVNHAFGSVKETKIIGCEQYFAEQIAEQARKLEVSHRNLITYRILPRYLMESIIVMSAILMISISVLLNGEGVSGTISVLGVFALASMRLLPAITNSINGVNQLRTSSYTLDQIYYELSELLSLQKQQQIEDRSLNFNKSLPTCEQNSNFELNLGQIGQNKSLKFDHQIKLSGITYHYPNSSRDVVLDVSLSIEKGESIAFIGKSGAGKTTLVDIILGLLTPQYGDLKVDGVSIYRDLRAWKNLIAYIPQSIFLIDDSIEKNIAFGVPDRLINRDKLAKAIEVAQLTEVIANLPHGINTMVGERGVLLSGGQRQRVGIARAIYHDREILVLDEATAALDNETEKLVTDSIISLSANSKITLITIAHRLSTIENCDRIYCLEQGRVFQSGSYEEVVLNKKSIEI